MKFAYGIAATLGLLLALPAAAQETAPQKPPRLLVVVSVDQFSADLFAEYRERFTGGFARLLSGVVFPNAYQSHAATETCPGHSTILTGDHPSRTGIISNDWTDFSVGREDKTIYCSEDETVPGSSTKNYTVSDKHLKVSTLGEWMKLADPNSRVVSVSGKDRSAVMMGGHKIDEIWYWWDKSQHFTSYAGRPEPRAVTQANQQVDARRAKPHPALAMPDFCKRHAQTYPARGGQIGAGAFARDADPDHKAMIQWKASPEFDEAILGLAGTMATDMKLGQGKSTDLLIVGASATDYVGHTLGTGGSEMCLQLLSLDQSLGKLFATLDRSKVDYAVVLTADHGGHDIPERNRDRAAPMAQRIPATAPSANAVGEQIRAELGLASNPLRGGSFSDIWVDTALPQPIRDKVIAAAKAKFEASPQVYAVYTRAQIEATAPARTPPETWTMLERARASYDVQRSGDLIVALQPRITPVATTDVSYIAQHGSFWDYDRRVPLLFWRKGMAGFEQPLSVETVDIAPTLAAMLGIKVPVEVDGRCLDLQAGPGDSCR